MDPYTYKAKGKKEPKTKALQAEINKLKNTLNKYHFSDGDPGRLYIEKQIRDLEKQINELKGTT